MLVKTLRALGAAALAASLATTALAQQQGVTGTEIVIGEILPLTGVAAVGSLGLSAGNKMAINEANAAGGINGRKIRLISEDDGLVVARAVQAARKLITSDKVFALAATSGAAASTALLPMIKETGLPTINFLSFPAVFHTPPVPNVFVAGATHEDTAEQLIRQMTKRFPGKKWAMITQDDEVGMLQRDGFERAHKALDLKVAYTATFRRGQKDFSAEILAATKAGAELLFAGGILTENVAMAKELERLGSTIPMGISWTGRQSSQTLAMIGPYTERLYLIDYVVPDESAAGRAFMERARRLLPEDEFKRANRYTLTGYAGTKVLLEGIRRCGKAVTWSCVNKELANLKDFETAVMPPLSYSASSHFAKQQLQLMKANPKNFMFQPLD